ncbi:MAG: class I SAM-dependent methyltransferase [Promethearchaeota archaeon]
MGNKRSKSPRDDWKVSIDRPEDLHEMPGEYWDEERIKSVMFSNNQARIQYKIILSALDKVNKELDELFNNLEYNEHVLDIGCGLGFVADLLIEMGYRVVGIDLLPRMISLSLKRSIVLENIQKGKYHPIIASALKLPFRKESFRLTISISALQWIKSRDEIQSLASQLHHAIKTSGGLVFQFYPRSKQELMKFGKILQEKNFKGGIYIDNPNNPKKRKIFIVMKK